MKKKTSEELRIQAEQDWKASPEFKTDVERIALRQEKIAETLGARAKKGEIQHDEHDYQVIGAYCSKCKHCGVIKDFLFDTPKYRNVRGKDRDYEPNCIEKI